MSTPPTEPQVIEGDESEMRCPSCGAALFDPADRYPEAGDVIECGSIAKGTQQRCTTKIRITTADWSLHLEGEVVP